MKIRAIWGTVPEKLKKSDKKLIIAGAALTLVLVIVFAVVSERETHDFSYELAVNDVDYAMVLEHYSGFDMSEKHTAIRLNWTNGVAELENGGASLKLRAKVYPVNLEDSAIEWRSANESVAVIDGDGNITVKAPGEVTFKATLAASGRSAEAVLTVIQPVTGLFLPTTNVKMYTNDPGRLLTAMIFPENATNTNLLWESNHPEIVSVDSSGRIKPQKSGNAVITAKTEDGGYQRICHVSVSEPSVEVSKVTIQNSGSREIAAGETIQLAAVPSPSNAKNKTPLKWESSDELIASVNQSGRVRGESAGTAFITVASTNGKTDRIEITVNASDTPDALDLSRLHTSVISSEGGITYTSYSASLPAMVKLQMGLSPAPKLWTNSGPRSASEAETAEYMNPNQFYTGAYKYQFLDLSQPNGVDADVLNEFLKGKGILEGQGETFSEAAREYGVSEVYLIAHACLESGNGTSQLANGVEYNGTEVYNVFGIGAFDDSAVASGSRRAYSMGWTSVEDAIRGGAEWISRFYIHNSNGAQNTLYKMLWNPENPGTHQYATDISWAVKQAASIERIFAMFPQAALSYDVPVYSGMIPPTLE